MSSMFSSLMSSLRGLRAKVIRSFAHRGFWGTLAYGPEVALGLLRNVNPRRRREIADGLAQELAVQRRFDLAFRVDTAGITQLSDLAVAGPHRDLGHYHVGTDPQAFARLMQACIGVAGIDVESFTFVDYGSGKGKAMLLASLWPFERVIGVEFAAALHEQAVRNIASFQHPDQRCRTMTSVHLDATQFELPETPLLLYFYNPFGEQVLSAILTKIEATLALRPRPVWVAYLHPYAHAPLDQAGFLRLAVADPQFRIYQAC